MLTTEKMARISFAQQVFERSDDDPEDTILVALTGRETALVTMGLAFVGAFTEHADRVDELRDKLMDLMREQKFHGQVP
jgi:hypothetical protein